MRISDLSSDVCSSDLVEVVDRRPIFRIARADVQPQLLGRVKRQVAEGRPGVRVLMKIDNTGEPRKRNAKRRNIDVRRWVDVELGARSEEHKSELQSLMRNTYAVFCLNKKTSKPHLTHKNTSSKR